MNKIITFIIPAYNSEKFLNKCLDAFITAAEVMEKVEVLIVSDGSKDATCDIAENYEKQYPQTFHLIAKENGGHGSVINTGSSRASGKYLKVIDADDWINTEALGRYVQGLENTEADVVLTHYQTIDISTQELVDWKVKVSDFNRDYTLADVHDNWDVMGDCLTFHGITYKTDFYQAKGVRLAEKVFYEDHQFATIPACFAESIKVLDLTLYIYRIGDVNQSVSDANQYKRRGHMQKVIDDMSIFYRDNSCRMTADGKYYYTEKLGRFLLAYYTTLLMCSPDFREGRKEAKLYMSKSEAMIPDICTFIRKRCRIMVFLNHLHISKAKFQQLLHSSIYQKIRNR